MDKFIKMNLQSYLLVIILRIGIADMAELHMKFYRLLVQEKIGAMCHLKSLPEWGLWEMALL